MSDTRKKAVKAVIRDANMQQIGTIDQAERSMVIVRYQQLIDLRVTLEAFASYENRSTQYTVNPPKAAKYYTGAIGSIANAMREIRDANTHDELVVEILDDMMASVSEGR